jgi:hypothetical protein
VGLCFDDSAGELEISCGWGWIIGGVVNQGESASAEGDNDRSADWCRSASDAQLAVRQSQTTVRVHFKGSGVPKAPTGLLRQFKLSFATVVFCALEGQCAFFGAFIDVLRFVFLVQVAQNLSVSSFR